MPTSNGVMAVVGAKGGVGKTTSSLNLAAAMAAAGRSVVAVELDIGMANFVDFLDVEIDDGPTVHDVLSGESPIEAARYRVAEGFFIAPSGTQLTGYADTDLDRLSAVVDELAWYHDVIIFDTPAGVGEEIVRSLELADEAIVVSTPRVAAIRNARNTIELTDRIGTDVRGLVLSKSGTGASPGADRIAEFLDVPLLGHVPEDDAVPHSQDRGKPVVAYAPRSGAAIAYWKIAEKLLDDASVPVGPTADAVDGDRQPDAPAGIDDALGQGDGPVESTESSRTGTDSTGSSVDRETDPAAGSTESTPSPRDDPERPDAASTRRAPTDDDGTDDQAAEDHGEDDAAARAHSRGDHDDTSPTTTDEPANPVTVRWIDNDDEPVRPKSKDVGSAVDGSTDGDSTVERSTADDPTDDESAVQVSIGTRPEDDGDHDGASETDSGGASGDAERADRSENDPQGTSGDTSGGSAGDADDSDDAGESDWVGGRLRTLFGL